MDLEVSAALMAFHPFVQGIIQRSEEARCRAMQESLDLRQEELDKNRLRGRIAQLEGHLAEAYAMNNQVINDVYGHFAKVCDNVDEQLRKLGDENHRLSAENRESIRSNLRLCVEGSQIAKERDEFLEGHVNGVIALDHTRNALNESYMQCAISASHVQAHAAIIALERRFASVKGGDERLRQKVVSGGHSTTLRDLTYWSAFAKAAHTNGLTREQIAGLVKYPWIASSLPAEQPNPQPRPVVMDVNVQPIASPATAPTLDEQIKAAADIERREHLAVEKRLDEIEARGVAAQDAVLSAAMTADMESRFDVEDALPV